MMARDRLDHERGQRMRTGIRGLSGLGLALALVCCKTPTGTTALKGEDQPPAAQPPDSGMKCVYERYVGGQATEARPVDARADLAGLDPGDQIHLEADETGSIALVLSTSLDVRDASKPFLRYELRCDANFNCN